MRADWAGELVIVSYDLQRKHKHEFINVIEDRTQTHKRTHPEYYDIDLITATTQYRGYDSHDSYDHPAKGRWMDRRMDGVLYV